MLRRGMLALWLLTLSACAINVELSPRLVATAVANGGARQGSEDSLLATAVDAYVNYLDTLRAVNAREARMELRERNLFSLFALSFTSGATVFATTNGSDATKAEVTGISSAAATFMLAISGLFHHAEDANEYRQCSRLIEGMLQSFPYPNDLAQLQQLRKSNLDRLEAADCLAPKDK